MKSCIYLDYNATALMRPEVISLVSDIMGQAGNASATHALGREARRHVERAHGQVAQLIGSLPSNIIFNSGATEANNTVLAAFEGRRILVSAIEHPSILKRAPHAEIISVTPEGIIDLIALDKQIKVGAPPALICVMMVNNQTGAVQPLDEVIRLAHSCGALVLSDAAQGLGRIDIDFDALGLDFMSLSSHKIAGPQGVGALVIRKGLEIKPLLIGGGQEQERRAGTLNVAGISGFGLAAEMAQNEMERYQTLENLRDYLEIEVNKIAPEALIYSSGAPRVANASYIGLPDYAADEQLMALDLSGIAASSGSSCTSGTDQPSHVLLAMGVSEKASQSAIRISMGWNTKKSDLERFLEIWSKIVHKWRAKQQS